MEAGSKTLDDAKAASPTSKAARKPIPPKVRCLVWGRAAGHCQYAGCNASLIGDALSNTPDASKAYIAHIISDDPNGPRGDPILSPKLAHDPGNLMLVCDTHHRVFDREKEAEHPVSLLMEMKRRHEERIRIVAAIDEDRGSHVLRYAARIGSNESPVAHDHVALAMVPDRYPVDGGWIDLDIVNLGLADHEPEYWQIHIRNLRTGFAEKVRGRMERNEIKRLSVFGLAPIPLLIELGRQISDISTSEVRQLFRHPKGWRWQDSDPPIQFATRRATGATKDVALALGISAEIADERIALVLGEEIPIWAINAVGAHNDIMRRREDLAQFAKLFRGVLDEIKLAHGEDVIVHLFPAVPPSVAVETGRSWQPKAHPIIRIYDQNRTLGGFIHAHDLLQNA